MKNFCQCWGGFGLWLALPLAVCAAGSIQLRPAVPLSGIDPGDHAIPCVTDWNGDGRKDLLVGYQTAGKIAVYLNTGSDAEPVFTGYTNLQAGGADIYHYSSGCGAPAPWVCDYDGDGQRDLLVGTGAEGWVVFYRNTNTDAAPMLAAGILVQAGGATLSVAYRATPYVCDWDGDGRLDLLCGNGDGYVYFFKNTNTSIAPVYLPGARLQAGGQFLDFGDRSVVRVFDWDGDGLRDLVGSAGGNVSWCRNVGGATNPVLAAQAVLGTPVPAGSLAPINTGYRMRLELVDWNNDGVTDLLVGNYDGTINYYEGYRLCLAGTPRLAGNQLRLEWSSAPYLHYRVLSGSAPNAITNVAALVTSGGSQSYWEGVLLEPQQFYRIVAE
jgi:hypothetical protein